MHGGDLGERMAARSRASFDVRVRRLRDRAFFLAQIGFAAAVAWWIGRHVLGHTLPFFAPVAAAVCLGMSYGQRLRRAYEVVIGVAVGVFIGDAFTHLFGAGVWQIAVVATLAMAIATLLGAGVLMTTQAGVQSIIVVTLVANTGQAFSRWADAVVGGAVALAVTVFVPAAPIRRPRREAAGVALEIGAVLRMTADAMRMADPTERTAAVDAAMERARSSEVLLGRLREASAEGMAVVRLSLFRRPNLPGVQLISDLLGPMDRALRNLRVLVRRCGVASRRGQPLPASTLALLDDLAGVTDDMARTLHERDLPVSTRERLVAVSVGAGERTPGATLDAEVVRAQVRSMVTDLLMLTGLTYAEAFEIVPPPGTVRP